MGQLAQDTFRHAPPKRREGVQFLWIGGAVLAINAIDLGRNGAIDAVGLFIGLLCVTWGLKILAELAQRPAARWLRLLTTALGIGMLVAMALRGI